VSAPPFNIRNSSASSAPPTALSRDIAETVAAGGPVIGGRSWREASAKAAKKKGRSEERPFPFLNRPA
jgi:hypothetical protein